MLIYSLHNPEKYSNFYSKLKEKGHEFNHWKENFDFENGRLAPKNQWEIVFFGMFFLLSDIQDNIKDEACKILVFNIIAYIFPPFTDLQSESQKKIIYKGRLEIPPNRVIKCVKF